MSTAARIPARSRCHFIVKNAASSIKELLALLRMFPTGPIQQTAGRVIVEERHRPPMQPLHNGSYSRKTHFGVRSTYIVPISAIQGAVTASSTEAAATLLAVELEQYDQLECFEFVLHVDYSTRCLQLSLQRYPAI
jgi:hypothetical protein